MKKWQVVKVDYNGKEVEVLNEFETENEARLFVNESGGIVAFVVKEVERLGQKITREYTVYNYDELSEEAKEKALEKLWTINVEHDEWEFLQDQFKEELKEMGITSEGMSWAAERGRDWYFFLVKPYIEDVEKFLKAGEVSLRDVGIGVEEERVEILKEYGGMGINTSYYAGGRAANHVECDVYEIHGDTRQIAQTMSEFLHDKFEDFLNRLEREYEYLTSRGMIEDTIRANEWKFLENGEIFF